MNVKKNPFREKTPSQRLVLLGGTPYDINKKEATTSNSGILYSEYNPILITPSTLDELVSIRGELNFLLIYNLIEKWAQEENPRTWYPDEGVKLVKEEFKKTRPDIYSKEFEGHPPNLYFDAWFEKIPESEPDFVISNPPSQYLVINCSSIKTPPESDEDERKSLAALSPRLPLGHVKGQSDYDNKSDIYEWLYSHFLIREFAGVRPSEEQYQLIDSTKYKAGAASMLTNGLPGVGKSTDLHFGAIELILQPGPNRDSRKLLYFTHDEAQKRIARKEIESILQVCYNADTKLVDKIMNSISFVSRKKMFGRIFPSERPQLEESNFNGFLQALGIHESEHQNIFYQYAAENFLKIVLGWFGSISKFREFTKGKTFEEAMDADIQLFQVHENHSIDGLPTMKMKNHWKGSEAFGKKVHYEKWGSKEWKKFNKLLNTITDSKKLRSYDNEKGEYWTYSINCEIIDEAYRRISSKDDKERGEAENRWRGKLHPLTTEIVDEKMEVDEKSSIWMRDNKNSFDAILVDEVQNYSPISLSVLLKHQSNRRLFRERSENDHRGAKGIDPFIFKATGDAFQSMTSNTFFENNRHGIDIFRGWGRFVRDDGYTNHSATGLKEIKDEYLTTNHRNSKPIVNVLNELYEHMYDEQKRSVKSKEIVAKSGAEEGAVIVLTDPEETITRPLEPTAYDILYVIIDSLLEQLISHEFIEQENLGNNEENLGKNEENLGNETTSRNTFLLIPDSKKKIDDTINMVMTHIEYLSSFLREEHRRPLANIEENLKLLAGKSFADNDINTFRSLLLSRGIASVKDVQGLTVEAAIVSGFREHGMKEFRNRQEAFVAFSRPKKALVILDHDNLDNFWRNECKFKSEITMSREKVENILKSKKLNDFDFWFKRTLSEPYGSGMWEQTQRALKLARGGYHILQVGDNQEDYRSKLHYDNLEKILHYMENMYIAYSRADLFTSWNNIVELEEFTQGKIDNLPKEFTDHSLFKNSTFFNLKLFLALQFMHRYGSKDSILQLEAEEWLKKMDMGGSESFFENLYKKWTTSGYRSEHSLIVFFYASLKLIHEELSNDETEKIEKLIGQAAKYLVSDKGFTTVPSLANPTSSNTYYSTQTNLESTILLGSSGNHNWNLSGDQNWNFPSPEDKNGEGFHYMPVEGEWSLRPQQIFDTFRIIVKKLKEKQLTEGNIEYKFQQKLCEYASLAHINDEDASIIELIEENDVNSYDAMQSIRELLSTSPIEHANLFFYLVENNLESVASELSRKEDKDLRKELEKYRIALESSSDDWNKIYIDLIGKIEEKKQSIPLSGNAPWFIKEVGNFSLDV